MKRFLTLSAIVLTTALLGASCEKRCNLDEGIDSGDIIHTVDDQKVILYPKSGYLSEIPNCNVIYEGHYYDEHFDVSFDGGHHRVPVDFSLYNVIANPKIFKCDVQFDREVVIDHANQIVTYNVVATECNEGCDQKRKSENWVLVPKFPETYFYYTN